MSDPKFTPGPWEWEVNQHTGDLYNLQHDYAVNAHPAIILKTPDWPPTTSDAHLIASAPAMDLVLELIAYGVARLERTNGGLVELCFDGVRYIHNKDWSAMLSTIGWGNARAALAKARGEAC